MSNKYLFLLSLSGHYVSYFGTNKLGLSLIKF